MFKKLLTAISIALASTSAFASELTLTRTNTITFRGVVDEQSVVQAEAQLLKLHLTLPKDQPVYLYLDTPGGSIDAGNELIKFANSLDREVKTITSFAASMGFVMAQQLGERLITEDGILMSHRAKIGLEGQIPGEFNTRSDFYMKLITQEETKTAERIGMNLKDYRNMIVNEYWTYGQEAVDHNMADKVVEVKCGDDLLKGRHKETVQVFIFSIDLVFSDCPLIRGPLAIGKASDFLTNLYPLEAAQVPQILHDLYYDQSKFVKEYITTGRYRKVFH